MKPLSFKKVPIGQEDILIIIKCVITFLQIIIRSQKKIDARLNKTLKLKFLYWCFLIESIRHTFWHRDTRYRIYSPILLVGRLFKWSSVLFCYFILWREKLESKIICILLLFARVRFYKSSFFILSFRHQDSKSYFLVVTAAKI